MRRSLIALQVAAVLLAACSDDPAEPAANPSAPSATSAAPPSSPSVVPSPTATAELPDGMPATFGADVSARDLPADELIPRGDDVTRVTRASTSGGEAVVIAFETPRGDPFTRARGFVVWRRAQGADPPWRATSAVVRERGSGVFAIVVEATDLTGDGSDDALVREETGGVGACATYRVLDLAAGEQLWKRAVCDTQIQPNPQPLGLYVVERRYEAGDPHCCPSAIGETVLAWNGDRFEVVSDEETPI